MDMNKEVVLIVHVHRSAPDGPECSIVVHQHPGSCRKCIVPQLAGVRLQAFVLSTEELED